MGYDYKKAIELLTRLAKEEGYETVTFNTSSDGSYIDWVNTSLNTPKKINIEVNKSLELQTYVFLHELGHHRLRKDWDRFSREFPILARAEVISLEERIHKYKRRNDYLVYSLEEEFRAWDEGYKLGVELGIEVDFERWHKEKTKSLMSYIRYYSEK